LSIETPEFLLAMGRIRIELQRIADVLEIMERRQ